MPDKKANKNHMHTVKGKQYFLSHPKNIFPRENTSMGEERATEREGQENRCVLSSVGKFCPHEVLQLLPRG